MSSLGLGEVNKRSDIPEPHVLSYGSGPCLITIFKGQGNPTTTGPSRRQSPIESIQMDKGDLWTSIYLPSNCPESANSRMAVQIYRRREEEDSVFLAGPRSKMPCQMPRECDFKSPVPPRSLEATFPRPPEIHQ